MKKTELFFLVFWIVVTVGMALFVLPRDPTFHLDTIGLLKLFYVALFNAVIWSFICCFRSFTDDAIADIYSNPLARAIFIGFYILGNAVVIGK